MATISIAIGPVTRSKTISGTDLTRATAALRDAYEGPGVTLTDNELVARWADNALDGLRTMVRSYENRKTADAAVAAQTDISLT